MDEFLKKIVATSIQKLAPKALVSNWRTHFGNEPKFENNNIWLLSLGKASVAMAEATIEILDKHIQKGLIVSPSQQVKPFADHIACYSSSHPLPDGTSLGAGQKLISFVEEIPSGALLITLISGGTSSLVVQPAAGISLKDVSKTYNLLLNSGADIYEINTVRKHISTIKGGQLLRYLNPEVQLIDLVISDVPGDELEIIGSGLTIPDSFTFQDAHQILLKHKLWKQVPETVRVHIEQGIAGKVSETLKPGDSPILNHESHIIGSARILVEHLADYLSEKGFKTVVPDHSYNDDVQTVASMIAKKAISVSKNKTGSVPTALIYYGESTVNVTGSGKGGRNQELALRAALEISGYSNITWLCMGTDGIDGPTDAAGAVVDGDTIPRALKKGLDAKKYLKNNDSYHFHEQVDTLLVTGATGNNLMDIQVLVIE